MNKFNKNFNRQADWRNEKNRLARLNFENFLAENSLKNQDDMERDRAIRLALEIEDRAGFAYRSKMIEMRGDEQENERNFLIAMLFLIWQRLSIDEQKWLKNSNLNSNLNEGDNADWDFSHA